MMIVGENKENVGMEGDERGGKIPYPDSKFN
jgi:hypothetical protein